MLRPEAPALSVSIVVYRSEQTVLQQTLASLLLAIEQALSGERISMASLRIICNDDSAPALLRQLPALPAEAGIRMDVKAAPGNIGYGAAHNLAIEQTASDYHLILNPDVRLAADALCAGLDYLQAHPGICGLSPRAVDGQGNQQYLCKRYPRLLDLLLRGFVPAPLRSRYRRRLAHYEMQDLPQSSPSSGIPIISGCFMLFRTQALKQLQGFDPDYFLYFEDFDLSLRAADCGGLAYVPAVQIVHLGGHSARKGWRHILLFIRSGIRFFNRWGWRLW